MSSQPPEPPSYTPPPTPPTPPSPPAAPPPAPPPAAPPSAPPPAAPPSAPPPGQPPAPPGAPPPSAGPVGGQDAEVKSAEQKALWGLIMGIANFFCCPLLFIGALIMGNQALAILDRPGAQSGSRGMANASRILGLIGIVWLILNIIFWIIYAVVIAGAAAHGGFS